MQPDRRLDIIHFPEQKAGVHIELTASIGPKPKRNERAMAACFSFSTKAYQKLKEEGYNERGEVITSIQRHYFNRRIARNPVARKEPEWRVRSPLIRLTSLAIVDIDRVNWPPPKADTPTPLWPIPGLDRAPPMNPSDIPPEKDAPLGGVLHACATQVG